MTAAALRSLFELYGDFLGERFPGTEPVQMSAALSGTSSAELKKHESPGQLLFTRAESGSPQKFQDLLSASLCE